MTLVALPSVRPCPPELQPFERLAAALSMTFSTLEATDATDAVSRAVADIGAGFGVDECTLIAYHERGGATVLGAWAAAPNAPCSDADLAEMPWLLRRLARNGVVIVTASTDFPHAAAKDRERAVRCGVPSWLGVPVALGARVAYGLVLGSRNRHAEWRPAQIERLRLIGGIIGAGLDRAARQEDGGRAARMEETRAARGDEARPPAARAEAEYLRDEARDQTDADQIVGEAPAFRLALTRLSQVAPLDATVLLLGETGTGKELFARALHDRSRRRHRTLVRVNCAALPASLIESELFGHERGAFTGAVSMRYGRFELADGGTIFLDEIGDLAPELQTRLLRVLQEGEFERVGSSKVRTVDVRVIAATHVDLDAAVAAGRFRANLFYRLSVFPITLPSLRERIDDIPQLVWYLIHRHQRSLGRRINRVPDAVMQALQAHDWAGNVRELDNIIERAMIRSADGTLQLDEPLRTDASSRTVTAVGETLEDVQRHHIEKVLRECGGRINGVGNAAVRLGLHPNTLRFRIKKLGVSMPDRRLLGATPPSGGRL